MKHFSIRGIFGLVICIMGALALVLVFSTRHYYERVALEHQDAILSNLLEIRAAERLSQLRDEVTQLAMAIQQEKSFRDAFASRKPDPITHVLHTQLHRYFARDGIVRLQSLCLHGTTPDTTPICASEIKSAIPCPDLVATIRGRSGISAARTIGALCNFGDRLSYSVLAPVGGLNPKAYLQLTVDPTVPLESLSNALGMPVRLTDHRNNTLFQSPFWLDVTEGSDSTLITSRIAPRDSTTPAVRIDAAFSIETLRATLHRTAVVAAISAAAITAAAVAVAVVLLYRGVGAPLTQLTHMLQMIRNDKTSLGKTLVPGGTRDVQAITNSFNDMSVQLAQLHSSISEVAINAARVRHVFLRNMSHELRTPLNSILGYTDELEEDLTELGSNKHFHALRCIKISANDLLMKLSNLLEATQFSSEGIAVRDDLVDLYELVNHLVSLATPLATVHHNTISSECPADIGDVVTDKQKISQILVQMIDNALKFCHNGSVVIRCQRQPECVEFQVVDTGIGIPEDKIEAIFEPFTQADDSARRRHDGVGLGLAVVKRYTQLLRGTITVHSRVGEGSTFTLRIPTKPHAATETAAVSDHAATTP